MGGKTGLVTCYYIRNAERASNNRELHTRMRRMTVSKFPGTAQLTVQQANCKKGGKSNGCAVYVGGFQ